MVPGTKTFRESIRISRNTGAGEFPSQAAALRKFGRIRDFVFVLDGDKANDERPVRRIQDAAGFTVPVFFLPSGKAPEDWTWTRLRDRRKGVLAELGSDSKDLSLRMDRIDSLYAVAAGKPGEVAKSKLRTLAEEFQRTAPEICRAVARDKVRRPSSEFQPFVANMADALQNWRAN